MFSRRGALLAIGFLLLAALDPAMAAATADSWLIDPAKYHVSAHGQLSCSSCHDGVASSASHPAPGKVNQPPARPDTTTTCYACHEGVAAALKERRHGRLTEQDASQLGGCVSCHDPHAVLKVADEESGRITAGSAPREQCGSCHEARKALPKPAAEDARCLTCHEGTASSPERSAALCLHCHGGDQTEAQVATSRTVARVDAAALRHTPHAGVACTVCHPGATAYGHAHQPHGDCSRCHTPHYSQAHDPHVNVDCQACHVSGGRVVMDAATRRVVRERVPGPEGMQTHEMALSAQDCERCHFDGNRVGASAAVLPAKSVLCVGCHAATLSVNDAVTIPSLLLFLLGMVLAISLWLSGAGGLGGGLRTVLSPRILTVLKSLLLDTVLQRRLRRQSATRWAIHSLIFLPFVARFVWGAVALLGSWSGARGPWFQVLLDKNHPLNASFFDVTGAMVMVGVCAAIARGMATRRRLLPGLPGQDRAALALIGGVVLAGFLLEGMRMAMTGATGSAAFFGHAVSRAFTAGPALARSYGYVWYVHAALTGMFVAYLPFSRMFHILVAPLVLASRAVRHGSHPAHAEGH